MAIYLGITGTGTGIGKTAFSAALVLWARQRGLSTLYLKPVQCGLYPIPGQSKLGGDAEWIQSQLKRIASLASPSSNLGPLQTHTLVTLEMPASPHLAAESAGVRLDPKTLAQGIRSLAQNVSLVLLEGAGGAAVPLNRQGQTLLDLGLPLQWIVAASPDLGTIHQTRATVEFMRSQNAKLAGLVFCQSQAAKSPLAEDNREILTELVELPCLGELPFAESWGTDTGLQTDEGQTWVKALSIGMDKWLRKQSASGAI